MRAAMLALAATSGAISVATNPLGAQEHRSEPSWEVGFENDAFMYLIPGMRVSDREYTNGVWLAMERNDAPLWGRLLPGRNDCVAAAADDRRCLQSRMEVGQRIYTPFIGTGEPPPQQRPYAGWLYLALTGRIAGDEAARSLKVEAGVTGPPSLAEQSQELIHAIARMPEPRGWEYQLPFEPGVMIRYEESRALAYRGAGGARIADAVLSANASVGNVLTGIQGSATVRLGYHLPHPWLRPRSTGSLSAWAFTGYRRQYVARDLFLDGSTFDDESPGVERIPTTSVWTLGAAATWHDVRLQFTFTAEDRLYRTQPFAHRYAAILIGLR